jgi:hypothetical protein
MKNWIGLLLSKYYNAASRQYGLAYKKKFALLPSVDHVRDGKGPADFKICAWRTNDSKNDLSSEELLELCEKVMKAANLAAARDGVQDELPPSSPLWQE